MRQSKQAKLDQLVAEYREARAAIVRCTYWDWAHNRATERRNSLLGAAFRLAEHLAKERR
jgi:hypothetical protein